MTTDEIIQSIIAGLKALQVSPQRHLLTAAELNTLDTRVWNAVWFCNEAAHPTPSRGSTGD